MTSRNTDVVLLLADPSVTAVPVADNGEPLLDAREAGLLLDPREADSAGNYARLRAGVIERLLAAESALPDGRRLLLVEGFRSATEQSGRFGGYVEKLRSAGVTDDDELRRQASAFVSPVEVAPHCTGGAVDLTLADAEGRELFMGGELNAHRSGDEASCAYDAPVTAEARARRALLATAMSGAGFVNYATEWWHWSYGDRYWAVVTGAPAAEYGAVG